MKTLKLWGLAFAVLFSLQANAQELKSKSMSVKNGDNEVAITFSSISQKTLDAIKFKEIKLVPLTEDEIKQLQKTDEAELQNKSLDDYSTGETSGDKVDEIKMRKEQHIARSKNGTMMIEIEPKSMAEGVAGFNVDFIEEGYDEKDRGGKIDKGWTTRRVGGVWQYFFTWKKSYWFVKCKSYKIKVTNLSYVPAIADYYYERDSRQSYGNIFQGKVDDYTGWSYYLPYGQWCIRSLRRKQLGVLIRPYRNGGKYRVTYWKTCF